MEKRGSEADVGRVPARLWVGRVELRIEGRRIRVGGVVVLTCDVLAVDDEDSVGPFFGPRVQHAA